MELTPKDILFFAFWIVLYALLFFLPELSPQMILGILSGVFLAVFMFSASRVRQVRLVLPDGSEKPLTSVFGIPKYDKKKGCYVVSTGLWNKDIYEIYVPEWSPPWVTEILEDLVYKVRAMPLSDKPDEVRKHVFLDILGKFTIVRKERIWKVSSWLPQSVADIDYITYDTKISIRGNTLSLTLNSNPMKEGLSSLSRPFLMIPVEMMGGKVNKILVNKSKVVIPTIMTKKVTLRDVFTLADVISRINIAVSKQMEDLRGLLEKQSASMIEEIARSVGVVSRITESYSKTLGATIDVLKLDRLPWMIMQETIKFLKMGFRPKDAIVKGSAVAVKSFLKELMTSSEYEETIRNLKRLAEIERSEGEEIPPEVLKALTGRGRRKKASE